MRRRRSTNRGRRSSRHRSRNISGMNLPASGGMDLMPKKISRSSRSRSTQTHWRSCSISSPNITRRSRTTSCSRLPNRSDPRSSPAHLSSTRTSSKRWRRPGLRSEVIEVIRDKWGQGMIERGGATTFWELWDVTDPQAGSPSRCHAWSASPLYHLSEQVLGVQQIDPGWRRAKIAPVCGDLDYARGTVPTPHGLIQRRVGKGRRRSTGGADRSAGRNRGRFYRPLGPNPRTSAGKE